jgi:quinol-cytochrome oxidoreductase complex cytochrome b subunit
MPFVLVGIIVLHIVALHQHGSSNPIGIDTKGPQDQLPFHPYYTVKDLYGLGVFLVLFFFFVFFAPNFFGEPDNYIEANPLQTPPHIVPEWYFLPFYAILRAFTADAFIYWPIAWLMSAKLAGVLAMFAATMVLFLLPWLDWSPVRSARYRPLYRQFFWLLFIDCFVLGWVGANAPEGAFVIIGQVATAYYFGHFIVILPLLSMFEKTRPLPTSISEPVLGGGAAAGAAAQLREKA